MIVSAVWERFGDVKKYVEPFFGGGAVPLGRPQWSDRQGMWCDNEKRYETVNDIDCYLANFWRATSHDPDGVARWATWPMSEIDLHARHKWLVMSDEAVAFREAMRADPDYHDVKMAGWWVWGISCWLGAEWCDSGSCVSRRIPAMGSDKGVIALMGKGQLQNTIRRLQQRLRSVRISCGDWSRVVKPSITVGDGLMTGVFLDPPYPKSDGRDMGIYANESDSVAHDVREWAIANGDNPLYRIAYCGYDGQVLPSSWSCMEWQANGGYSNQGDNRNRNRERIWFSPHCLREQMRLFEV